MSKSLSQNVGTIAAIRGIPIRSNDRRTQKMKEKKKSKVENLSDEKTGLTPLIHSILKDFSSAMISTLIEGGAELDQRDRNGMSSLHHCVSEGKLESLSFLLEKGADPNIRDLDGVTCINLAKSSHGMYEFVELLLKYGADPTIKDKHGKTYLM